MGINWGVIPHSIAWQSSMLNWFIKLCKIIYELRCENLIHWIFEILLIRNPFLFLFLFFLIFNHLLMLLIYKLLLPLDIFEHILVFWYYHIIREHFWVFIIKFVNLWQSLFGLILPIKSLQVLRKVIEDQIVLKNWNYVSVFIVHNVTHYFGVIIILRC